MPTKIIVDLATGQTTEVELEGAAQVVEEVPAEVK